MNRDQQTAETLTANPAKGRGERYIFCERAESGECLDIAIKQGWSAFNCENCGAYLASETYRDKMLNKIRMDSRLRGNDRGGSWNDRGGSFNDIGGSFNDNNKWGDYMTDSKNQLIDLNDALFRQMDRLTNDKLNEQELAREINRSKAVSNLAAQIVQNAKLALEGARAIKAKEVDSDTLMLGRGK